MRQGVRELLGGSSRRADELESTAKAANREELESGPPAGAVVELLFEGDVAIGFRYGEEERLVELEFDPTSGLERRIRRGPRERRYGNWKNAGGVLLPMWIEDFRNGVKETTIVLASATHTETPSAWCLARFAARATSGQPALPADETEADR